MVFYFRLPVCCVVGHLQQLLPSGSLIIDIVQCTITLCDDALSTLFTLVITTIPSLKVAFYIAHKLVSTPCYKIENYHLNATRCTTANQT